MTIFSDFKNDSRSFEFWDVAAAKTEPETAENWAVEMPEFDPSTI